ncbi:CARDB domain-containing protein [Bacterioplanes sanyensis]|nr:CARDB domain-containing protein [Bacterioplanes sanyensis]
MSVRSIVGLLLLWMSASALTDPILDYTAATYKAAWYPNFYQQQGPMTCPQTCEVWTQGAGIAEQEKANEPTGQFETTHVCKISSNEKAIYYGKDDPDARWLYGNQFDQLQACFTATPDDILKSDLYMCLCVYRCQQPDLIVSKIHDPTWDHANNRSVVQVTISNIGTQAAAASHLRLTDTGNGSWTVAATPALAAGASVTLTLYFNGYWVFDPNAELKAEADYKGEVDECDESNNTLEYFKMG